MQGREASVESGEYAGKIHRRHGQANYGATKRRLCVGVVLPFGTILQSIYRKPGNTGFKVGIGLVAQLGTSGTMKQRHLSDRTDDQNSLLGNADGHHEQPLNFLQIYSIREPAPISNPPSKCCKFEPGRPRRRRPRTGWQPSRRPTGSHYGKPCINPFIRRLSWFQYPRKRGVT